uniref:Uncharacterized protein n=2 Tax=Sar TaxID=2698737 RepID=A0A7S3PSN0_9STRA
MDYTEMTRSDTNTLSAGIVNTNTNNLDEATYSSLSAHGYSNSYVNDSRDYLQNDHAVFRSVAVAPNQPHRQEVVQFPSSSFSKNGRVSHHATEPGSNYFDLSSKNVHSAWTKSNWKTKDELAFPTKYRTPLSHQGQVDGEFVRKPPTRLCIAAISLCHVYVTLTLHNLCRILTELFDEDKKDPDYKFDAEKCQWEITLYSENLDETVISVYVYTCPGNEGTYMLEFCKETGCAFTYSRFFGRIKSELAARGMAYDAEGKRLSADCRSRADIFGLGSLCDLKTQQEINFDASLGESDFYSDSSESDDLDFRSLFELYLQLATSKTLDTRLEGFKLIASELGKGGVRAVEEFLKAHATDSLSPSSFLVNASQSDINGICRCAVTALAHISAHTEYHGLLLKAGTVKVMTELYGVGILVPETKRQLVTVLSNMCCCQDNTTVCVECKEEVRKNGGKRIFHACLKAPSAGKRLKEIADMGLRRLASFNELVTVAPADSGVLIPEKDIFNVHVSRLDFTDFSNGGSEECIRLLSNSSSIIMIFLPFTDDETAYANSVNQIKDLCEIIGNTTFLTSVVLVTTCNSVSNVSQFAKRLEKDTDLHFAEKYTLIMNSNEDIPKKCSASGNSMFAEDFERLIELMKEALPGLEGFQMSNSGEEAEAAVTRLQSCQLWLEDLRRNLSSTSHANADFAQRPALSLNVREAEQSTKTAMLRIFERLKWITSALESSKYSKLHGVGARWDLD